MITKLNFTLKVQDETARKMNKVQYKQATSYLRLVRRLAALELKQHEAELDRAFEDLCVCTVIQL